MNLVDEKDLEAMSDGQLKIAIGIQAKHIIVEFMNPVAWLALDKVTATLLANAILKNVEELAKMEH